MKLASNEQPSIKSDYFEGKITHFLSFIFIHDSSGAALRGEEVSVSVSTSLRAHFQNCVYHTLSEKLNKWKKNAFSFTCEELKLHSSF